MPHIIEVFHPAVADIEDNHGVDLLGDDRFRRVHPQPRWAHPFQNGRKSVCPEWRIHGIAKADVDLHPDSRLLQPCGEPGSNPRILGVLFNDFRLDTGGIEDDSVVALNRRNFADPGGGVFRGWRSKAQQVEVFGRPVQATLPRHEKHGSFDDERVALPALSKPEVESLDRIARQEGLKVLPRLPAGIQEPRAD